MNSSEKKSGNKLAAKPGKTGFTKLKSLLNVNMKYERKKHDIVINIRLNETMVADIFRHLLERPAIVHFCSSDLGTVCWYKDPLILRNDSGDSGFINLSAFTRREIEIMNKLSRGLSCREIAEDLHLSLQTVKNHKTK